MVDQAARPARLRACQHDGGAARRRHPGGDDCGRAVGGRLARRFRCANLRSASAELAGDRDCRL